MWDKKRCSLGRLHQEDREELLAAGIAAMRRWEQAPGGAGHRHVPGLGGQWRAGKARIATSPRGSPPGTDLPRRPSRRGCSAAGRRRGREGETGRENRGGQGAKKPTTRGQKEPAAPTTRRIARPDGAARAALRLALYAVEMLYGKGIANVRESTFRSGPAGSMQRGVTGGFFDSQIEQYAVSGLLHGSGKRYRRGRLCTRSELAIRARAHHARAGRRRRAASS